MKKNLLAPKVATLLLIFLFSSCASIVSKGTYPLSISSNPVSAKVSVTDKKGKEIYVGTTPASIKLKSGAGFFSRAEYQVRLSSAGYDDKVIPVNFKIDGWYFGNILIGGLIGMVIIDPATGSMWKIEEEFINESLQPSVTAELAPELKVVDLKDVPNDLRTHLQKLN